MATTALPVAGFLRGLGSQFIYATLASYTRMHDCQTDIMTQPRQHRPPPIAFVNSKFHITHKSVGLS